MDNVFIYVFTILYFILMIKLCGRSKLDIKTVTACGIIIAITLVLRMFYIVLPTTGRVTLLSVLPIMILSIIYGIKPAFLSGMVVGIMAIFLSPTWVPVHWAQIFIEHLVAYSCLSLVSVFGKDKKYKIIIGAFLALFISILAHTFAGVVFFGQYATEGYSPWMYSIIVNLSAHGVENIMALVVLFMLPINRLKKAVIGG